MKVSDIEALARILREQDLTVLDVEEGDTHVHMERSAPQAAASLPAAATAPAAAPWHAMESAAPVPQQDEAGTVDFNHLIEIKSPMVGVFYDRPSENAMPFVSIGKKVKKGDVLCIIEAMKLMNEITAECDGEVVDICIENGQVVEFGQTLLKLF